MRKDLHREIPMGVYPALRLALLLITGIALGHLLNIAIWYWFIIFCPVLLLMISTIWIQKSTSMYQIGIYLIIPIAFGGLWSSLNNQETELPEHKLTVFDQGLIFYGHIQDFRKTAAGYTQVDLRIDSVGISDAGVWNVSFKTTARTFDSGNDSDLITGNYISFNGTLSKAPEPRNPNDFDYGAYLESQGIHSIVDIDRIIFSNRDLSVFSWLFWRDKAQSYVERVFSEDTAPLAKALLLGDRSSLGHDYQTAFSRVGLAHMMAVSGMHVGFVLLPFLMIIPYFWTFRFGKYAGLAVALFILIAYSGVTGFSTSVVRASIMAILIVYGKLFQKPRDLLNLLGVAALIILLINPNALFNIGFQLSFTAVLVILLVLPVSKSFLPLRFRYGNAARVFQFVGVSVFVQAGLYPILMYYFNEFSIIGPLSNTIFMPFIQLMFLWSIFCISIEAAFTGVGSLLNTPSDMFIGKLFLYAEKVSALEWSWVAGSISSPPLFFFMWAALFLTVASLYKPAIRWKMIIVLLFSLCLHQAHLFYKQFNTDLVITIFDVGQGDAILLETPDGKNILFDTGILSFYQNSADRVLMPELNARGIKELDAVILSHPHADHIGGISTLINNIPIKVIYDQSLDYDSNTYKNYLESAGSSDIPIEIVGWGDVLEIGDAVRFFVTGPHPGLTGSNPNTWSIVVKVVYGNTAILLAGDADKQSENKMVKYYGDFLKSDLLKVGHHASRTSSGTPFLEKVQPAYSAASLARQNRYEHPHPEATLRLHQSGTETLFTSLNGALIFTSDGEVVRHKEWRK
ncbi:MAG: DNA internalization-related competence protein ComEC/Rec2 [Balneolales bacterium]